MVARGVFMKKGNLFLTLVFVALAVMVGVGSMFTTFVQAQDLALAVAATDGATKLFDDKGNFAVERNTLNNSKGQVFNFFGQDWYLVNVNDESEVATFWMVEPYGNQTYIFDRPAESGKTEGELFESGATIWRNGYTNTVWNNKNLGESQLRASLREIAKQIIDGASYKNYKDRVVSGMVSGSNANGDADGSFADGKNTIANVYCAKENPTSLDRITTSKQNMIAEEALGADDRLWVPSVAEIRDGGLWGLTDTQRHWDRTTVAKLAWLRTPDTADSYKASLVGYSAAMEIEGVTGTQSLFSDAINKAHGVRPAVHLNLRNYNGDEGNKGGWFTDDMMKVFFIIICVLGVIGVILVIIAVVAKARRDKKEQSNA